MHPDVCRWFDTTVGIPLLFAVTKISSNHSLVLGRFCVRLQPLKEAQGCDFLSGSQFLLNGIFTALICH